MFTVATSPTAHRDRSIMEFQDVISVTLKQCRIPERRNRLSDGSTHLAHGPVFDTLRQAEEYIRLAQEIDALEDLIKPLRDQQKSMAIKPQAVAAFRSNKPRIDSYRAYYAWRDAGAVETLTPVE